MLDIEYSVITSDVIKSFDCTTYDYGCNTESYRLIRIATNDGGLYPWLIRLPVHECVTWALQTASKGGA